MGWMTGILFPAEGATTTNSPLILLCKRLLKALSEYGFMAWWIGTKRQLDLNTSECNYKPGAACNKQHVQTEVS
jgi:hypothetical protein